jgi:hypothetical protein
METVVSAGSDVRLYNKDLRPAETGKYKMLKLGGGLGYDRSSD